MNRNFLVLEITSELKVQLYKTNTHLTEAIPLNKKMTALLSTAVTLIYELMSKVE
ncbi:hypothetical protein STRDD04_00475 [Streptococcus sp. DD04]|nr:hypothetical protein STRDD04_00475 [Streptococcus sp. DD04]